MIGSQPYAWPPHTINMWSYLSFFLTAVKRGGRVPSPRRWVSQLRVEKWCLFWIHVGLVGWWGSDLAKVTWRTAPTQTRTQYMERIPNSWWIALYEWRSTTKLGLVGMIFSQVEQLAFLPCFLAGSYSSYKDRNTDFVICWVGVK